jgi:hypothetical protein
VTLRTSHTPFRVLFTDASRFPFPGLHTNCSALALALHVRFLEHGFICQREVGSGAPIAGFAPPVVLVPSSELVPPEWTSDEEASFVATFSHAQHPSLGTVKVSAAAVPGELRVEVVTGGQLPRTFRFAILLADFTTNAPDGATGTPPGARPFQRLSRVLARLCDPATSTRFCDLIQAQALSLLLPAEATHRPTVSKASSAVEGGGGPASSSKLLISARAPPAGIPELPSRGCTDGSDRGRDIGRVLGAPYPRPGGDFDSDLMPPGLHAGPVGGFGWPGTGSFHPSGGFGGGGSLVGPDHGLFHGGALGAPGRFGGPDFGARPPGVPPGARFDPFMPPGALPFPSQHDPQRPLQPFYYGPNPDHLPPPQEVRTYEPQAAASNTGSQTPTAAPGAAGSSSAPSPSAPPASAGSAPDYIW